MNTKKKGKACGCRYDGPLQIVSCADHNAAAKNLNRAQVMITRLELKLETERRNYQEAIKNLAAASLDLRSDLDCANLRLKEIRTAWKEGGKYFSGTFKDGPASPTPDREGIIVHETKEGREALLKLAEAING